MSALDDRRAHAVALHVLARQLRSVAADARASSVRRSVPRVLEQQAMLLERDLDQARKRGSRLTDVDLLLSTGLALAGLTIASCPVVLAIASCHFGFGFCCRLPIAEQARTDALAIGSATELYLAQDPGASCPWIEDLTEARILSASTRTDDPWGMRYRIRCPRGEITVTSSGPDRLLDTPDDVVAHGRAPFAPPRR